LTEKQWIPVVQQLSKCLRQRDAKICATLILDNLGVHRTLDTLFEYKAGNLNAVFFPPNSSHILQPADDKIFAVFKSILSHEYCRSLVSLKPASRDVGIVLMSIAQGVKDKINSDVIQSSFRTTGIFPFDAEIIEQRVCTMIQTANIDLNPTVRTIEACVKGLLEPYFYSKARTRVSLTSTPDKLYDASEVLQQSLEQQKAKQDKQSAIQKKKETLARSRAEKSLEKRERQQQIANTTCKGDHSTQPNTPRWTEKRKGSNRWLWCESCDYVLGICDRCVVLQPEVMEEHEKVCAERAMGEDGVVTDNDDAASV
jgi:hypothetical protein